MVEFRWIKMSLFLILLLQLTVTPQHTPRFVVSVGDEVTLPCENVIHDQDACENTNWLFSSSNAQSVELIKQGQINEKAKAKSDRLSVAAKCSLFIKKVTAEDVGYYTCRQIKSGQDANVYLSVVTMTEHKDPDKVTLTCSVSTSGGCGHTVKWLYEGKDVDKDNKDMKTLQSDCTVTVAFLTSSLKQKSQYHELLKCEVTDDYTNKVQLLPFSPQPSGEEATTIRTTENRKSSTNITAPGNSDTPTTLQGWWSYIIVAIGLVALVIIIVTVIRWKRTKGNKTQMDENTRQSLNPVMTESAPETSQDMADPEVSYVSISYTRKTNSKAKDRVKNDDDEGDAVTYSTVKASSSSGSSADPSNIYATIN
ncbi:uncharacterized protein LOC122863052 isoform X2 [Siniperca chuatsi]|uniref:uncharacterized protein LOC122863052 isoform X2 n=1 Tax=Siniperca chuatsi TaxID=119488 RepID=UPI001CE1AB5E|nr:uncharacterized protein LOC122863052 isoform X2 [Siniperca chuatsi]